MDKVDKFAQWLNSHPDLSDITRFLVENTFAEENAQASYISVINDDRTLTFIGEYGHKEDLVNKTFPADEWRNWREKGANTELNITDAAWRSEIKTLSSVLIDKSLVKGFLAVSFTEELKNPKAGLQRIKSLSYPLSIYLSNNSLLSHGVVKPALLTLVPNDPDPKSPEAHLHHLKTTFSERQITILRLLAQGETNHAIAKHLGYSVSTVRHEVMRIFRALNISSRHEAGPVAANAGLI